MNGDAGKQLKRIIIDLDANDPDVGEAAVRGVMEDGSTVTFHQATRQAGAAKLKAGTDAPKFLDASSITIVHTNPCRKVIIGGKIYSYCW